MANPFERSFIELFDIFKLEGNERLIYELLRKKPMTIKQLQNKSHISERMLRTYLDDMVKRGFITRKIIEEKRLKYVYYANPPENIMDVIKKKLDDVESFRKMMEREIIKGSKI